MPLALLRPIATLGLQRPEQGRVTKCVTLFGPAARTHCADGSERTGICQDAAGTVLGMHTGYANCVAAANTMAQIPCDPSLNELGEALVEECGVLCCAASLAWTTLMASGLLDCCLLALRSLQPAMSKGAASITSCKRRVAMHKPPEVGRLCEMGAGGPHLGIFLTGYNTILDIWAGTVLTHAGSLFSFPQDAWQTSADPCQGSQCRA